MAIFNLSVSTISRSQGRSATAAAAYRAGVLIEDERTGEVHDYARRSGVEHVEIVAPTDAPAWASDRSALWNAAEAKENRRNSVVAREWRISLPHELGAAQRVEAARAFAQALADRYGVAADVAIHAPGREGDERNHHAHILTTTRRLDAEGLGEKTRELDVKQTSSAEVTTMREAWERIANGALERAGRSERIDHRSLEAQQEEAAREAALAQERGDADAAREQAARAEALDRAPEPKLGPARAGIERRAQREAREAGRAYEPVTARGAEVAERREERALMGRLREQIAERVASARGAFEAAREDGAGVVRAAGAAIRAGTEGASGAVARLRAMLAEDRRERATAKLKTMLDDDRRERLQRAGSSPAKAAASGPEPILNPGYKRLRAMLEQEKAREAQRALERQRAEDARREAEQEAERQRQREAEREREAQRVRDEALWKALERKRERDIEWDL